MGGAPSTGLAPATSGLTGRCYHSLSYDGAVHAPGLEPSVVRGKSPVPCQSGVARHMWSGRDSDPLCRKDGWSKASWPHGATDPTLGPSGAGPNETILCGCQSAVVRTGCPARTPGRSRTPGRRFWRPRRHHGSSARNQLQRAGRGARRRKSLELRDSALSYQQTTTGLPVVAGSRRPSNR
jgi:hypothetical protein